MKNIRPLSGTRRRVSGFTLLELMMVVGIIGLVVAMGVPAILSVLHEGPMRKAVNDVTDICFNARAQAIMSGHMTEVTFHPLPPASVQFSGGKIVMPSRGGGTAVNSTQFDPSVQVAMLDINLMDFGASDVAYVRFWPNGTCDEMNMVLDAGDQTRRIVLDPITSMTTVTSLGALR